jgi:hypothetical protein
MSGNHTTGPWHVTEMKNGTLAIASKATRYALPLAYLETALNYKVQDNARLIAAAPDMLEALILAEIAADPTATADERAKAKSAIRAAITKATGDL